MKRAFIKAISYYLPEKVLTNTDLINEFPEWSLDKLTNKLGISQRHVVLNDETSLDMAVGASKKLFEEYMLGPADIDFIILCTQSPDYFLPTSACLIQDRLGISKSCGALDINLGCSGFIYGLALAKGLLVANVAEKILLLTSESYSKMIHAKDKSNRAIFGDGSAATLISNNGFAEILNFSLGTDGSGFDNLILQTGGFKNSDKKNDLIFDGNENPISSDYLYMNGSEILNFTLEKVPESVHSTLEKNNLANKDIDLYVFHQANKYILEFLRKKLRIEENKFYYFIENVGNTVSSTIPIALYEAKKQGKIKGHILIAGFGVGYSWGGCILKTSNRKTESNNL